MDGYAAFAEISIINPECEPAFRKTSAVLSKREMDELGWQQFRRNG